MPRQVDRFLRRVERMRNVRELLNEGKSQAQIARELDVRQETIATDVVALTKVDEGILYPEVCAEQRLKMDGSFLELAAKAEEAYQDAIKDGNYRDAAVFFSKLVDIYKYRAKIWGLELPPPRRATEAQTVNMTKVDRVDVNLTEKDRKA